MKKKLIFEDIESIEALEQKANGIIELCNSLLAKFNSRHNHFGQPINEEFARSLLREPVKTFDDLLRANSPVKAIPGKQLDIEKLAELTGINREGFISDFTVVMPGTIDRFNRKGIVKLFELDKNTEKLLIWNDSKFVLNDSELENKKELHRTYAETPQENESLKRLENFIHTLNEYTEISNIDTIDCNRIAMFLKMEYSNGSFGFKPRDLVSKIKTA